MCQYLDTEKDAFPEFSPYSFIGDNDPHRSSIKLHLWDRRIPPPYREDTNQQESPLSGTGTIPPITAAVQCLVMHAEWAAGPPAHLRPCRQTRAYFY